MSDIEWFSFGIRLINDDKSVEHKELKNKAFFHHNWAKVALVVKIMTFT